MNDSSTRIELLSKYEAWIAMLMLSEEELDPLTNAVVQIILES